MNLTKINNELKSYINESTFISMKCRNKLLKIFSEEFDVNLDISNYQNVDLKINDDFTITYREDNYKSSIIDINDLEEKYNDFKEKADNLLRRKEIDFQNKSNMNNISNLLFVLGIFIIGIIVLYFGVIALIAGHYIDCIWFIVFIVPVIIRKIRDSFMDRLRQAKRYLSSLIKRVK